MDIKLDLLRSYYKGGHASLLFRINKWGFTALLACFLLTGGGAIYCCHQKAIELDSQIAAKRQNINKVLSVKKNLAMKQKDLIKTCSLRLEASSCHKNNHSEVLRFLINSIPDSVVLDQIQFKREEMLLSGEGEGREIFIWGEELYKNLYLQDINYPHFSKNGERSNFKLRLLFVKLEE
ncbi:MULTISPECIES: hypothetical protein [Aminobacterium]|jgi:hypothetical protein|uniref:Fimbrial assembly family protein n=1 Tax=Aminobacterium colombiense (strain DSM 12261 / ALA-1) TaxID=572547 RepID=D5EEC4_AMICL|nr:MULTISPECIES: hypothetical protein [Aminobacterium]MDD2379421.1 hypothetical protein [Aminobacterium colombiense]ADE56906.1 hypothetical protein Amico_0773 [Aminobacterium colombiense DSM 12261]MDD3767555.1 hypothetical protein [Aminobacterium colombiense]MDD4266082.1 hypothetical protein [Aminobacterium colombiense]MDD4586336.1 hypothetical protein [Aminobacterium colombiense]